MTRVIGQDIRDTARELMLEDLIEDVRNMKTVKAGQVGEWEEGYICGAEDQLDSVVAFLETYEARKAEERALQEVQEDAYLGAWRTHRRHQATAFKPVKIITAPHSQDGEQV